MKNKKEPFLNNYPKIQGIINVIGGFAMLYGAYYLWFDLEKWETEGGVRYSSRLFFKIYETLGREVLCIGVALTSLIFFYTAFKKFTTNNKTDEIISLDDLQK